MLLPVCEKKGLMPGAWKMVTLNGKRPVFLLKKASLAPRTITRPLLIVELHGKMSQKQPIFALVIHPPQTNQCFEYVD